MSRIGLLLAPSVGMFVIAMAGAGLAPLDALALDGGLTTMGWLILFGELVFLVLSLCLVRNDALPPALLFSLPWFDTQFRRTERIGQRQRSIIRAWLAVTVGVDLAAALTSAALTVVAVLVIEGRSDPESGADQPFPFGLGLSGVGLRSSELVVGSAVVAIVVVGVVLGLGGAKGLAAGPCLGVTVTLARLGPPRSARGVTILGWLGFMVAAVVVTWVLQLLRSEFVNRRTRGVVPRAQPL